MNKNAKEEAKTLSEETHKFAIVKNYPESRYYEINQKNNGLFSLFLKKIGLKKT